MTLPVRHVSSPVDEAASGKKLREQVSRASQQMLARRDRDPIAILQHADASRIPELVPIRYGRMLASPFAFYRGSAGVMADDLAHTPSTGITVQACGDCHLKNFGGFATPERDIVFDINDFDETLPAPWEWDLKRLTTSFILAVRENGLGEEVAYQTALKCSRWYRKEMASFAELNPLDLWYTKISSGDFLDLVPGGIRQRLARRIEKVSSKRGSDIDYPKLTQVLESDVRIRDNPPLIFHPESTREAAFETQVTEILHEYRQSLPDDRRVLLDRYRFVDAAIKVVGIGSVGTRCWIVLLMSNANEPLFLQVKQANPSVLEPYAGASAYGHPGRRVVMGQRLMQAASDIFLGWTTGPNGDFYVRQLRDAKIGPNVETFDADSFDAFARACGWNLARTHAKTGNARAIAGYIGKSDELDEAIASFAKAYADRAENDYAALKAAVRSGRVAIFQE